MKKAFRIIVFSLLGLAGTLLCLWLVMRNARVQTWMAQQIIDRVEERLGNAIEIGKVKVRFPRSIVLKELIVWDQLGDTVLYLPHSQVGVGKFNLKAKEFSLSNIQIDDPFIYVQEDPGGGLNIDFILDALSTDTTKPPLLLDIKEINLREGRMRYHTFRAVPDPVALTADYIDIDQLNLRVNNLFLHGDTIMLSLDQLAGYERVGFGLSEASGRISKIGKQLVVSQLQLKTTHSAIVADALNLQLDGLKQVLRELKASVHLNAGTSLSERDVSFFLPDVMGSNYVNLIGEFEIDAGRLTARHMNVVYPDVLQMEGDFICTDLTGLKTSNYNVRLDTLLIDAPNLRQSLFALLVDLDTVDLPVSIAELGLMRFAGQLNGSLQSLQTQGNLICEAGSFNGQVNTIHEAGKDSTWVSGQLAILLNYADSLFDINMGFGRLRTKASFSGIVRDSKDYQLNVSIDLPQLAWRSYPLKNTLIDGNLRHKNFEGVIALTDPNLAGELDTRIDFSGERPFFNFGIRLDTLNLHAFNINLADSVESLRLNMHGSFSGTTPDEMEGQIWITDSYYANTRGELPFKHLELTVGPDLNDRRINLVSDYIDARVVGAIYVADLPDQMNRLIRKFMPVPTIPIDVDPMQLNDFSFNIQLKNPRPFTEIISPGLIFKDNTQINGFFRRGGLEWQLDGFSPQYVIANKQFTNLVFNAAGIGDSIQLNATLTKVQFDKDTELEQIVLSNLLVPDHLHSRLSWNSQSGPRTQGELVAAISFEPGMGKLPRVNISLEETMMYFKDTSWQIGAAQVVMDDQYFRIDSLLVGHSNEQLLIDGTISDLPLDTLSVNFEKVNLNHLKTIFGEQKFELGGFVSGSAKVFDLHEKGLFLADLGIDDFTVNGELLGKTDIISRRPAGSSEIILEVETRRGDISTIKMGGSFDPETDLLDFEVDLEKLRMNVFNAVLEPTLTDVRGIASGGIRVTGSRTNPQLNGEINLQKAGFNLDYLGTRYTFTHSVQVSPKGFLVKDLIARDKFGNEAVVNGGIRHDQFKNLRLDFSLDVNKFLCLDTKEDNGDGYWGTAFATGFLNIMGPLEQIEIDISAKTESGTNFSVPVSKRKSARSFDFISYATRDSIVIDPDLLSFDEDFNAPDYNVDLSGLILKFDLEVTPDAVVQIIFDAQTGDVIRAQGRGNLIIDIDTRSKLSISGDYLIDDGDYLFTLDNMPIKRFDVEPGSRVSLNGRVGDSNLDVIAVYNTKAALYDLVLDNTNEDLRQRIPVTCQVNLTGRLETPDLKFDIVLPPSSDDVARSQLNNLTEQEINKQIFSLLILNRFSPLPGLSSSRPRSYESAGISTTTEVLSNQLNYLLSQISSDFDIGFNYRPGDELSSDEVEVAMSTQLLDDRMTINVNGNVDVKQVESDNNANQLVGNVELEYKIIPSGKIRVKAFTRANDRLLYEYSDYTQGFGIFFREEFDRFPDLIQKYWQGLFKKDSTGQTY